MQTTQAGFCQCNAWTHEDWSDARNLGFSAILTYLSLTFGNRRHLHRWFQLAVRTLQWQLWSNNNLKWFNSIIMSWFLYTVVFFLENVFLYFAQCRESLQTYAVAGRSFGRVQRIDFRIWQVPWIATEDICRNLFWFIHFWKSTCLECHEIFIQTCWIIGIDNRLFAQDSKVADGLLWDMQRIEQISSATWKLNLLHLLCIGSGFCKGLLGHEAVCISSVLFDFRWWASEYFGHQWCPGAAAKLCETWILALKGALFLRWLWLRNLSGVSNLQLSDTKTDLRRCNPTCLPGFLSFASRWKGFPLATCHCMTICDTIWSWWTDARLKLFDNCKTLEFSRGKANKTDVEQVKW